MLALQNRKYANQIRIMKYIITTAAIVAMTFAAHAGCGKKVASIGKVSKVDSDAKSVTIEVADSSDSKQIKSKKATLKLTPDTKVLPAEAAGSLEGKNVSIVSEHGKIDYVIVLASK